MYAVSEWQSTPRVEHAIAIGPSIVCGLTELYDTMRHYLATAREALSESKDPTELKQRLIDAFPDFKARVLPDHQMRFLFPKPQPA